MSPWISGSNKLLPRCDVRFTLEGLRRVADRRRLARLPSRSLGRHPQSSLRRGACRLSREPRSTDVCAANESDHPAFRFPRSSSWRRRLRGVNHGCADPCGLRPSRGRRGPLRQDRGPGGGLWRGTRVPQRCGEGGRHEPHGRNRPGRAAHHPIDAPGRRRAIRRAHRRCHGGAWRCRPHGPDVCGDLRVGDHPLHTGTYNEPRRLRHAAGGRMRDRVQGSGTPSDRRSGSWRGVKDHWAGCATRHRI
mmetsp:Transcript_81877/g.237435  ORF Transcript_81877/g.237435 Transcript_81877/m.237435 type:complete len:248 (+) Transcript_81877:281-1024(+)